MGLMKTASTALALASMATATSWNDYPRFNTPSNKNNECSGQQSSGFDWGNLGTGSFSSYGGFDFSGWSCSDRFSKRDTLTRRGFGNKVIQGKMAAGSGPSMSCKSDADFSATEYQVSVSRDTDVEFCYTMPDGTQCKQTASCKTGGTVVQNSQCGGAQSVSFQLPKGSSQDCDIGVHSIGFDCSSSSSSVPPASSSTPVSSSTPTKPASSVPAVPSSSAPEVPSSSIPAVPSSSKPVVPSSSVPVVPPSSKPVVPSSKPEVPASSKPEVPASSKPEVPASSKPEVPASSKPEVPASSKPEVPASSKPEVPASSKPEVPASSKPEVPASSKPEVPASSKPEVPASSKPEVPASSKPEVPSSVPAVPSSSIPVVPSKSIPAVPSSSVPSVPSSSIPASSTPVVPASSTPVSPVTSSPVSSVPAVPSSSVPASSVPVPSSSTPVVPASSTSSSPASTPTLPCPEVLPKCLSTWIKSSGCKDNSDFDCYCKKSDFTANVIQCVTSYGETTEQISAALSYLQGICAKYIPENPGLITNCPSSLPSATVTPPPAGVPSTSVVWDDTTILTTAITTETIQTCTPGQTITAGESTTVLTSSSTITSTLTSTATITTCNKCRTVTTAVATANAPSTSVVWEDTTTLTTAMTTQTIETCTPGQTITDGESTVILTSSSTITRTLTSTGMITTCNKCKTTTAAPVTPVQAFTTISIASTFTVPCTYSTGVSAGMAIPSSSTITALTTAVTVPWVHFTTAPASAGATAGGVAIVPGPQAAATGITATTAGAGAASGAAPGYSISTFISAPSASKTSTGGPLQVTANAAVKGHAGSVFAVLAGGAVAVLAL